MTETNPDRSEATLYVCQECGDGFEDQTTTSVSRREVLQAGIAVTTVGLAGCGGGPSQDGDSSPTPTGGVVVTTPEQEECTVDPQVNPTASEEGVVPREYPPYPSEVTAESVVTFVIEYERAYRHNELLAGGARGTDTIIVNAGVPSDMLIKRQDGFLVGVTATIDTEDNRTPEGGTAAPAYSDEFAVWYLLTETVGLRGPDLPAKDLPATPPDSVDLSEATVLYCG